MGLSVMCITADPAHRIKAVLEPLRDVATEIVIAADSRLDIDNLSGYRSVADRLYRIEFRWIERHLAWLRRQCREEWVLRLDGDEVVSPGLVAALPELLADRDVRQYHLPRRWVYPDAEHWLAQLPWLPDFQIRLARNEPADRYEGTLHSGIEAVWPARFVEHPIYHLDVLTDVDARRDKVLRYEAIRPRHVAPGGGPANDIFYLPENIADVQLRPLPAEDAVAVRAVLDARPLDPMPSVDLSRVRYVSLAESDRYWEGRTLAESAYRGQVAAWEPAYRMAPAEVRKLYFRVVNDGDDRWPWQLQQRPEIRVGYLLHHPDGHIDEGPRSPLPHPLGPGDATIMPVEVSAPEQPGAYRMSVGLVHENVRWFGELTAVTLEVAEPSLVSWRRPLSVRTPATPRRRFGRGREMLIPRTLHRVWIGGEAMPERYVKYGEGIRRLHPRWEHRIWTDADADDLGFDPGVLDRCRSLSERSNLYRYAILARYGGVYVDTDVEGKRPFDRLLAGVSAFAALKEPGQVGTAILGSVPGHRAFERLLKAATRNAGLGPDSATATGPYLCSLVVETEPDVTVFGSGLFYPDHCDEPERAGEAFPEAYAVHHWR